MAEYVVPRDDEPDYESEELHSPISSDVEGGGAPNMTGVGTPSIDPDLEICYDYASEDIHTPVSSDDDEYRMEANPQFNDQAPFGFVKLELSMEFTTMDAFRMALKDVCMQEAKEIKYVKNDPNRVRAKCVQPHCPWLIFCSWNSVLRTFQVKTFISNHTCNETFKNKMADRQWLARKLAKRLRTQPKLGRLEAQEHIKEDYNVDVCDKTMYRALKRARELVEGNEKEQYGKVRDYLHEILRSNPGSTALLNVMPQPQGLSIFNKLYVCLDACKKGWMAGCRPFIGLDGCFLKGYYGGQLLSAVGQDANNHVYVIAYAVVDSETKENWKWFLTLLQQDLGDAGLNRYTFMSDQQKGLLPALNEVAPHAHYRNCVLHIWKNFIKKWKDKEIRGIVWECANSTTVAKFNFAMQKLRRTKEDAWAYLNNINPTYWVKAYFNQWSKVDNLTNNMCEVWNAKIVNYREKPILTMLEEVRCYMMRKMAGHAKVLGTYAGAIAPVQQKRLDTQKRLSNKWRATFNGDEHKPRYEVHQPRGSTKVCVNLVDEECTCNFWQLTGLPCQHACAAILGKHEHVENYVHQFLKMDSIRATYAHFIQPLQSEEFWIPCNSPKTLPPKVKRPIGRPKIRRRKNANEEAPGTSSGKTNGGIVKRQWRVKCSKCGEEGHYAKTCKGPANPRVQKAKQSQEEMTSTQSAPQVHREIIIQHEWSDH